MEYINIKGRRPLYGNVNIHGAKNSVLPVLAASILSDESCIVHNCPDLSDVRCTIEILTNLGCKVKRENSTVIIDPSSLNGNSIEQDLMTKMRSSIIFLGAILARKKTAIVCFPGGCELGPRPIDLHLKALKQLGVNIFESHGFLHCSIDKVIPCKIHLDFPSVGATENIMLLSCLSEGETTIINAAREPEIEDLQNFLNSMGADITGAGNSIIRINGVSKLRHAEHTIIPDRIVASTYLAACMSAGGKITISNTNPEHLHAFLSVLSECGATTDTKGNSITVIAPKTLKHINMIRTSPYPGFPTDSQSIAMSMLSVAEGTSLIKETIFEGRFRHAFELMKMGANIKVDANMAIIQGVDALYGSDVYACDLRSGAGLVVAALGAYDETKIYNVEYIHRGYENLYSNLRSLGADIERKK